MDIVQFLNEYKDAMVLHIYCEDVGYPLMAFNKDFEGHTIEEVGNLIVAISNEEGGHAGEGFGQCGKSEERTREGGSVVRVGCGLVRMVSQNCARSCFRTRRHWRRCAL